MKRKLFILAAAMTLVLGSSITVCAQPEIMPDGTVFDAEYYAQANPDVAAVLGTDTNMLYSHYVNFGKAEGRLAAAPDTAVVPTTQSTDEFDAAFYAAAYPDVVAVLGNNPDVLYQHYVQYGKAEGRLGSATAQPDHLVTVMQPVTVTSTTDGNHCPYPLNEIVLETSEDGLTVAALYTTVYAPSMGEALHIIYYDLGMPIKDVGMLTVSYGGDSYVGKTFNMITFEEGFNVLSNPEFAAHGGGGGHTVYFSYPAEKVGDYAEGTVYRYLYGDHYYTGAECPFGGVGCKPGTITIN